MLEEGLGGGRRVWEAGGGSGRLEEGLGGWRRVLVAGGGFWWLEEGQFIHSSALPSVGSVQGTAKEGLTQFNTELSWENYQTFNHGAFGFTLAGPREVESFLIDLVSSLKNQT